MDHSGNGAASIGGGWCVNISPTAVQTTITTSPAGLLVSVDGGTATTAPLVENWVPGSTHTIATTSPQAGGTGVQYVFSSWSDSGAISHSITVPSTATTYAATFSTQYQLTTAANPSNGGAVSPPSGNYYAANTVAPLTATPNANYTFSSWTGNVANASSASTTVTMNGPQSVTANFAATQLIASPSSLDFGSRDIGGSHAMLVAVQNVGTTKVTVGSASIASTGGDPNAFSFSEYCKPLTLKPGKECFIGVRFRPHTAGLSTATLNIPSNAAGSPLEVPLMGTGVNKK